MTTESFFAQFYQGHLNLAEFGEAAQNRLAHARVLCVGAGGLACHLLPLLTTAGVGRIDLIDDDRITTSNLQRQTLFTLADRGHYKAQVATARLRSLNPDIAIDALNKALVPQEAEALFTHYDMVLDCADNASTTQLINHAARRTKRPWVYASVQQMGGQYALFTPESACYACLFSQQSAPPAGSCSVRGVFSPAVAVVAAHQAALALRALVQGADFADAGVFFSLSLASPTASRFAINTKGCDLCRAPVALTEYHHQISSIGAHQLTQWQAHDEHLLVDVRPSVAHQQNSIGDMSMPFGAHWQNALPDALLQHKNVAVCVMCERGNASKQAARMLLDAGFNDVVHLAGGISEWQLMHDNCD